MPKYSPLADNPRHLALLCEQLELGAPVGEVQQVIGGFSHRMWRLQTDRASYAIKQLAPRMDLSDASIARHFDTTEAAAAAFACCGIAAIHALPRGGHYLHHLDASGYLVYPWTNARAIDRRNLSPGHAMAVATLLARMHTSSIDVPALQNKPAQPLPPEHISALVAWSTGFHARDHQFLEEHQREFEAIAARQEPARYLLAQHLVCSHGDMDQKNVLWDEANEPVLIDWENACRLNPTYELLLVALDWSGITSAFEYGLFEKFIVAYRQAGGIIESDYLQAAFDCVLGDWLNWLMFNVGRSFDTEDPDRRSLGGEQVDLALGTLLRLQRLLPRLVSRVSEQAAIAC